MKMKKAVLVYLLIVFVHPATSLIAQDDIHIEFERYSDRVLLVKAGNIYFDQVAAIASQKGLIIIDTGKAPTLTQKYRKIIERELGRDDFTYVINTHFHFDHTSGNQIFADADIIAHDTTPRRMRQFDEDRLNFVADRRQNRMVQWANQLEAAEPGSEQATRLQDYLSTGRVMLDDLEKNYALTLPTITFNDRMTLDMGDLTLNLYYFGEGLHTGDDIIIHCPEEKILFTGDLFYYGSMFIAFSSRFDAPRWMEVLNDVLRNEDDLQWLYDCHNRRMTRPFIALWRDYLVDMWESLNAAKEEGLDLEAVQDRFSYDRKFTYLENSGIETDQLRREHQTNLRYVWYRIHEFQSAADEMRRVIDISDVASALKRYREITEQKDSAFYFDETEFNRLGYQFLQGNNLDAAVEIFKINVERFPESWNVYDSLAEAYMNAGQTELAIQYYTKSLELNPENQNAIEMLKRLEEN